MADTTPHQSDKASKINHFSLGYTQAAHGKYFVAIAHRNWPGQDCRFYYHPTRASLLRINRALRRLIRRVDTEGYVADYDAWNEAENARHFESLGDPDAMSPAVTVEPEDNTELAQLVTTEYEAALLPGVPMCALPDCLDGAEPGRDFCARHLPRWTGEQIIAREG